MKKQLLTLALVLVGLMSNASLHADDEIEYIDKVAETSRYIYNISMSKHFDEISFRDEMPSQYNRYYQIRCRALLTPDSWDYLGYRFTSTSTSTGASCGGCDLLGIALTTYTGEAEWTSANDYITLSVKGLEDEMLALGCRRLRVVVVPFFTIPINETNSSTVSYYGSNFTMCNAYEAWNNYMDFVLDAGKVELVNSSSSTLTYDSKETVTMQAKIIAVGRTTYRWQRSIDDGKTWVDVESGVIEKSVIKQENIVSYTYEEKSEAGVSSMRFRCAIDVDDHGVVSTYVSEQNYNVYIAYKLTMDINGNISSQTRNAGTLVTGTMDVCEQLEIDCDQALNLTNYKESKNGEKGMYSFLMPGANVTVHISEKAPCQIEFRDYDGSLLKSVEMACGSTMTGIQPAVPNHAGLTFQDWWSWSGNYENGKTVYNDIVFHARYTLNDLSFSTSQEHISKDAEFAGAEGKILLGDTLYFVLNITTPLFARATAQFTSDGGKTWSDSYSYELAENQATQGATVRTSQFVFNTYERNYESFGFRWYVMSGGQYVYGEPLYYDMYAPVTVSATNVAVGVLTETESKVVEAGEEQVFHVLANDTMYLQTANFRSECMRIESDLNLGDHNSGWQNDVFYVAKPRAISSILASVPEYNVYFEVIGCGKPLGINNVWAIEKTNCGGSVEAPIVPYDPNYQESTIFDYWMDEYTGDTAVFEHIMDDMSVMAIFLDIDPRPTYTVTFRNWDNSYLGEVSVKEGETAVAPVQPLRDGYIFKGWDPIPNGVVENMTVTAVFEEYVPVAEAISQLYEQANIPTQKVLYNGHIYIIRDQRIYDAQGRLVE